MSIFLSLSSLALRQVVEGACAALGARDGGEAIVGFLTERFTDHSQRLARALQQANDNAWLANEADLRANPPKTLPMPVPIDAPPPRPQADDRLPPAGTILTRRYKGAVLQVKILADGFEHDGQVYASLSAVAKAITGSHCNGFLFFRGCLNQGSTPA